VKLIVQTVADRKISVLNSYLKPIIMCTYSLT